MQKRSSWQIQKAVFKALFIRELQTRFGGYRLGYFWALIEPLSHIIVLSFVFSILRDGSGFYDTPFPVFFATGILVYFVFQKVVLVSQNSITVNRGLFAYRQVKPFDAIIVRSFIELITILASFLFLMWFGSWFFGLQGFPADPLRALLIVAVLFMFSIGLGFIAGILGAMYEEAAKFIPILMRPLYFISGIFFPLGILPLWVQEIMLWNPVLHAIEEFRTAYVGHYPSEETSLLYVLTWAVPSLFIGLLYYRANRTKALMA